MAEMFEVREVAQGRLRKQNEAVNFGKLVNRVGEERLTRTLVLEARTDIRLVARLEQYFLSQQVLVQTRSELVRAALELLHDWLVIQGKIEPLETLTYHDAYDILARFGNLHKGGQNRRMLAASLVKETVVMGYRPSTNLQDFEPQELSTEFVEQQKARALQSARDAGILEETRDNRAIGSDEYLRVKQEKLEEVPDSASLFIKPAIVVED